MPTIIVDPAADRRRAQEFARAADSANTRRAYEADIRDWESYSAARSLPPWPIAADVLVDYFAHMDGRDLKAATIRRRCSALRRYHRDGCSLAKKAHQALPPNPFDDDDVRRTLRGIERERGVSPNRKRPMTPELLREAIAACTGSGRSYGNLSSEQRALLEKAILLVGFSTALRRSELVEVKRTEATKTDKGFVFRVGRSKLDQLGAKEEHVAIVRGKDPKICAVRALEAWLKVAPKDESRIFPVCDRTVARIVKRAARAVGVDEEDFAGHSLRAGMVTTASEQGVPQPLWMLASRHKSPSVAQRYARIHDAERNPAFHAVATALAQSPTKRSSKDRSRRKK